MPNRRMQDGPFYFSEYAAIAGKSSDRRAAPGVDLRLASRDELMKSPFSGTFCAGKLDKVA
jgi:hypothetical protein